MSTRTYTYGAQAAPKINPKMLEDMGYGEFKYCKIGETGYWKFDTEKGRNKFLKDFAGLDAKEAAPFDDAMSYMAQTGGMVFLQGVKMQGVTKLPASYEIVSYDLKISPKMEKAIEAIAETPEFKALVTDVMKKVSDDMTRLLGGSPSVRGSFAAGGIVTPRKSYLVGE